MPELPRRVLPPREGPTAFFWTSGADGGLRFLRCSFCAYFIHPPTSYCPRCGGRESSPERTAGRGTVYSFTINHQPWDGSEDPYVIAVVELDEQPGLRLMTNFVGAAAQDIRIGMPVEVVFEGHGEVHLPLFQPVRL
jgi:uncharacterized OB-fold protein